MEWGKVSEIFSVPVLSGLLGALLYVAWEFSEWRQAKQGQRIPWDVFFVKAVIYAVVAGVLCNEYSGNGKHLSFLAGLQIGVSSPLIWRQMYEGSTKQKLQDIRSTERSIN
jgi:hypothetical protein